MTLSKQKVRSSYQSTAKYYDFAVKWFYRLIGIRTAYRSHAVKLLYLKPGDFVVELGCGTGLNFPLIMEQIGPEGRLIDVDISANMLASAQEMVERSGWKNVELVESDITAYDFPKGMNGILSVGVFGYIADSDNMIKTASQALVSGGRLAIIDGKQPNRLPL